MIRELETVVLTRDFPEHGLNRGDIGAVVHCYKGRIGTGIDILTRGRGRDSINCELLTKEFSGTATTRGMCCGAVWKLVGRVVAVR